MLEIAREDGVAKRSLVVVSIMSEVGKDRSRVVEDETST